jgi:hypothetical protein
MQSRCCSRLVKLICDERWMNAETRFGRWPAPAWKTMAGTSPELAKSSFQWCSGLVCVAEAKRRPGPTRTMSRSRGRSAPSIRQQGWQSCGLPAFLASATGSWPRELRLSQPRGRRPIASGVGQKSAVGIEPLDAAGQRVPPAAAGPVMASPLASLAN